MDRREDALRQALDNNAAETERWQTFKSDNESAIRNLEMFVRKLSVEVMVPIGKKALMPGELIHTNELLVGHYEGYFSQCSAHKAQEICRHRLKIADEQLKKLQAEADLWQNKLSTPLTEGAVASGDQVEIVEDFNEESHNKWMAEHRERVRRQKEEERLKRQAEPAGSGDDVLRKLEEREMMEELGLDPDNLSQEMLDDILNPEPAVVDPIPAALTEEQESEIWKKLEAQEESEKTKDLGAEEEESLRSTEILLRQLMSGDMETTSSKKRVGRDKLAPESAEQKSDVKDTVGKEDQKSVDSDEEDEAEEVQTIREQMSMLPIEEREPFLRSQIQILTAKMRKIQKVNFISDELVHLMNVVVMLEDDLQDMLCDLELEASDAEQVEEVEAPEEAPAEPEVVPEPSTKTRRISFAAADEKLEFRREETVAEMLPNARKNSRDVIRLDEPIKPPTKEIAKKKENKPSTNILQKVEKNIDFVKENQSVQDFDLLNQILEESTGRINTLHISFNHSNAVSAPKYDTEVAIPGTPADFYEKYEKDRAQANASFPIFVNGFEGEDQVKVPIMTEASREAAYEDPRSQFSKPGSSGNESSGPEGSTKSILRNKSAVEQEPHIANQQKELKKVGKKGRKPKKKERTLDDDLRDMSAYQKVMHELVEKEPAQETPEPLPQGKFIDTHAPKKRVSRFKEQRNRSKT
ncbi:unconventional prefoldin RPB5 interactor-like protein [Drosophila bipectinata]|uniref:unconventional prefoldin RPB5 interactor-like protein n=1 Tax=Drosophila bipectinata TaxID=42026 RepID=UPI0038B2888F